MALGFDRMYPGPLKENFKDRAGPLDKFVETNETIRGKDAKGAPYAVRLFADAGREHMEKFGTTIEQIAKIAAKNHKHSQNNKNALFRKPFTTKEVMESPMVHSPVQILACCPNSDGAAAAILVSEEFVRKHQLEA